MVLLLTLYSLWPNLRSANYKLNLLDQSEWVGIIFLRLGPVIYLGFPLSAFGDAANKTPPQQTPLAAGLLRRSLPLLTLMLRMPLRTII